MKDKNKRDAEKIADLEKSRLAQNARINEYDQMCRSFISLVKSKHGDDLDVELFDIIKDHHFLRKLL